MSTYTSSLGLELITPGSQAGLWGNTTNNTFTLIDQAVTGVTPLNFASASGTIVTLTDFNGALDQSRSAVLNITGSATGPNTVVIPNKQKTYLVRNNTGQDVIFQTPTPAATYTVGSGYSILIFADGNNNVFTGIQSPNVGTLPVSGGGTGNTTFGAGGFIKSAGGTTSLTVASKVNMTTEASGVLPVANGGTGQANLPAGELLIGTGTNTVAFLNGTVAGYVATWNGSTWVAAPVSATGGVTSVSAGTGIQVSAPAGAITVTNTGVTQITAGTGITISGSTGNVVINASGTSGVATFSAGTTGLTPSAAATGPVTLGGVLNVSSGGTGATTINGIPYGNGTSPFSSATGSQIVGVIGANAVQNATNATTAADATQLGGVAASSYAQKAVSNTWTAQQIFSGSCVSQTYNYSGSAATFQNGGVVALSVNNVNVYTDGSGNWTIPGNGFKPGGGAWADSSDIRLKTNIQTLTTCMDTICALNPVQYTRTYEGAAPEVGFIADEVELVIPSAVSSYTPEESKNGGGYSEEDQRIVDVVGAGVPIKALGFRNDIFAYLVGAIKELKSELDAANARIAALEAQ